jgi:eukaryotic-like serine/threonine-protein kinase
MLPELTLRKRRILTTLGLFILLAGTALITMEWAFEKGRVLVPDLVGAPVRVAMERLKEEGLLGKVVGERYHPSLPKGSVIVQDPAPRSRIKTKRTVALTISRGTNEVFLPDFALQKKETARKIMGEEGLMLGELCRIHSDQVPDGKVIAQSPPAGTKLRIGDSVSLLVSSGPDEKVYLMPDLIGKDAALVSRTLAALGFKVRLDPARSTKEESRHILSQEPIAGHPVASGSKILLRLERELEDKTGW